VLLLTGAVLPVVATLPQRWVVIGTMWHVSTLHSLVSAEWLGFRLPPVTNRVELSPGRLSG
jgi:hypothetical protein